jgi:glycosyltransferase involved in cell wall biosynthesis
LVVSRDPGIDLRVVGNIASTGLPRPGEVVFAGMVDDLAGEYLTASVALVPLRAGSGLKVKLIEALAHGVPVVSTSVGAEGVEAASPDILRIHDDPEGFAKAILALTEPSAWPARSVGAAAFARAHYSESAARAALAGAFEALGGIAGSRQMPGAGIAD